MTATTNPVNAFIGWPKQPTDEELAAELGPAKALWDELVDVLSEYNVSTQEWKSYSRKAGWSLSLKCKTRTIVYLIPCSGCFRVAFVLGDKAMKAARAAKLPAKLMKILDEAPRYAEGTGVRIGITRNGDIPVVQKLAAIKLDN
jgi:hypothetical protein